MDFAHATEPSPGRDNEDFLVVSPDFAVLLDGVTQLPGLRTGCVHSPRWLVRALGAHLAGALMLDPAAALDEVLATAIDAVCDLHRQTCDLANPDSPSSTVAMVRQRAGRLDYLVLCDSTVVFQDTGGVVAVTDARTDTLPAYDRGTVAALRNRPGGFWVASTAPEAAAEAVTGSVDSGGLFRLLLCSDGVSRLVEHFGHSWADVFATAERDGPRAVIDAVRRHEHARAALPTPSGRKVKQHDDATVAVRLRGAPR